MSSIQKKPCSSIVQAQTQAIAVRPDIAAQMLGVSPFRIEELMRSGQLQFRLLPGSDERTIPVSELIRFYDSLPLQTGKLEGRGRFKAAFAKAA